MKRSKILFSALVVVFGLGSTAGLFADDGGVIVTPPGKGTIRVEGEVGAGQTDELYVLRCQPDEQFLLKRESCQRVSGAFKINSDLPLNAGIYKLTYQQSRIQGVRVEAGQTTTVSLTKIDVPAVEGQKFRVFSDLTNSDEMHKAMVGKWSNGERSDIQFRLLACATPGYSDICAALQTSPDALNNVVAMADERGSLSEVYIYEDGRPRHWRELGRRYVNKEEPTGGFVSVFPGVYGVQFKGGADGDATDTYGIVVP